VIEMTNPQDIRRHNRRLGLILVAGVIVLHIIAVIGVIALH
jgi:hypothetical protein